MTVLNLRERNAWYLVPLALACGFSLVRFATLGSKHKSILFAYGGALFVSTVCFLGSR